MIRWYRLLNPVWLCANVFTLYGGGKGDSPATPDYSQLAAASAHAADVGKQLGEEQLAQNQQQYERNMAVATPVIQAQTNQMNQQAGQSSNYFNYMLQNSRPVEQQLFYNAMGLTPDEIAQVEQSRSSELAAQPQQTTQQASIPSFVDVPTQSLQLKAPDGAIKGDAIGKSYVKTGMNTLNTGLGGAWDIKTPINTKVDPNAYYIKGADGTYRAVNPSYETVNGTKQVQIPGAPAAAAATGIQDTPQTNAMLAKMSAAAGVRQANEAADTAIADSRTGATQNMNMAIRQGLRYGMSSDKIAAAMAGNETQQAQQQAAAAYGARTNAQATRVANLQNVDSLYKGLPAASNASANTAIGAGNSAVGNQMAPSNAYMSGITAANGTQMQGQQLNITGLSSILNNQTSAYNAANSGGDSMGGLGSMIGQLGAAYITNMPSDKNIKKDIKATDPDAALDAVKDTDVSSWKYDASKGGPEDDETHIGPMAQDVQKNMGDTAGPGGKMVDLISLNGINMAAIKALAAKVDKLEKKGGKNGKA